MQKITYKKALQVTHLNVASIMALPCISKCFKTARGNYLYHANVERTDSYLVGEGDWLVEREDGVWEMYSKQEWEKMQREDKR